MIVEFFVTCVVTLINNALGVVRALTLPKDISGALATFISYGNYIVGSDLLLLFATSVATWMMIKLSVSVILFVWRLLPLT